MNNDTPGKQHLQKNWNAHKMHAYEVFLKFKFKNQYFLGILMNLIGFQKNYLILQNKPIVESAATWATLWRTFLRLSEKNLLYLGF